MDKAIFLDRDGTIIEEKGYICHLRESWIFPFSYEALRLMKENHFKVICVTNQAAIARGICTRDQVEQLHVELRAELLKGRAVIDRFYYCPFHVDGIVEQFKKSHPWRKPMPGMLLQAAEDCDIDLSRSYMIGDDLIDIVAGKNAGCKTVLVLTGRGCQTVERLEKEDITPDLISENILTAVKEITR